MQVNILGTDYKIIIDSSGSENPKLVNADGYLDRHAKEIVVSMFQSDPLSVKNIEEYAKEILRHEIVHAFFFESGNILYGHNESLVDWIAVILPKLSEACEKAQSLISGKVIVQK